MSWHSSIKRASHDLLKPSGDASRIAETLAGLSDKAAASAEGRTAAVCREREVNVELVSALIRARRARAALLPQELFADPGWDILLDLLEAELANRQMAVSSVCVGTGIPTTTVVRWLKVLEDNDLVTRCADPADRRRVFVELSADGSNALRRWFAENFMVVAFR